MGQISIGLSDGSVRYIDTSVQIGKQRFTTVSTCTQDPNSLLRQGCRQSVSVSPGVGRDEIRDYSENFPALNVTWRSVGLLTLFILRPNEESSKRWVGGW
jgi:hypothetical protein